MLQLHNSNLTEAERADDVNYLPGDVLEFHQNAKGFRKGRARCSRPNETTTRSGGKISGIPGR